MDRKIQNYAAVLMQLLHASAELKGSAAYPYIHGYVRFYQTRNCLLIAEEITDLPHSHSICQHPVFGFHIYDGNQCDGDMQDPFSGAMAHYNPAERNHPFHALERAVHTFCLRLTIIA